MPRISTTGSADADAGPRNGRPADRSAGFVLMEIIPAMVILGLGMILALATLARGTGPSGLMAMAVESAALLRNARTDAIASGRETTAVFDTRRRDFVSGPQTLRLPRDIDLAVLAGDSCATDGSRIAILFRPDGTSCGGVIRFTKGARSFRVRVNWATGTVAIVDGA
ncbi:GspH/FimT family pseudopilin [Prosthecomicrobium hirschii]|uniref:GspH/FimT family pseudopilin n=1 Tax=Prosthecodimorpha hirschii TaxID=665126 RepID=UPI00112DD9F4|nr:GspH/FimT family pseudopilin [Prosthecomicrobium hirschii]MCW1842724.1 hypothetical protein [Prosthecomicrobium hirschii]